MNALETVSFQCPYCWKSNELTIDASARLQKFVDDCQVCCGPIYLTISVSAEGEIEIVAEAENR